MEWLWLIFLFVLGACIGSFLNVVIWRLPRGESIVFPGSHCPNCGHMIRWYDNIPLLSWLLLGGRCRSCKGPISPRYLIIEAVTAVMVSGLYAGYFIFDLRRGGGLFLTSWPTFAAHAALLCGLLVCAVVDIEKWIVPLEVCWFVSAVGLVSAAAAPHPWMPRISDASGAMAMAAAIGLIISIVLTRWGLIQPSFIDADDRPVLAGEPATRADQGQANVGAADRRITSVAMTKAHGVDPRREVLREVLFLAPAMVLAATAYLLVTHVEAVGNLWHNLNSPAAAGRFASHFGKFQSALLGYLVGGLWVWGIRILGTLAFGKEAMGLGDVHLLAAVGAVTGWIVPTVAFFVAPFFGLLWALYVFAAHGQRELPYGPWLAIASLVMMLGHDPIMTFLSGLFWAGGL